MSTPKPEVGHRLILATLRRRVKENGFHQVQLAKRKGLAQSTVAREISCKSQRMNAATREALHRSLPARLLSEI